MNRMWVLDNTGRSRRTKKTTRLDVRLRDVALSTHVGLRLSFPQNVDKIHVFFLTTQD